MEVQNSVNVRAFSLDRDLEPVSQYRGIFIYRQYLGSLKCRFFCSVTIDGLTRSVEAGNLGGVNALIDCALSPLPGVPVLANLGRKWDRK